nr:GNAT family N-acetyltransferase [uncultured Flavobacterium sp.]
MYTIKKIEAEATFPVRHCVLRSGKPLSSCYFEGDKNEDTAHFEVFEKDEFLGIASFFAQKNIFFHQENQFQLRGMPILDQYQNKGLGKKILQSCELHLKENMVELIWFNARESAIGFYTSLGYNQEGVLFDSPDVGPHFIMRKTI